jgi:ferredoxin
VKVLVDDSVCTGHGRCYALAPDVFAPDDYGHCALVHAGDGAAEADVPDVLADAARLGRDNCPEQAITLSE